MHCTISEFEITDLKDLAKIWIVINTPQWLLIACFFSCLLWNVSSSRQFAVVTGGLWCFRSGPGLGYGAGYEVQAEKRQR